MHRLFLLALALTATQGHAQAAPDGRLLRTGSDSLAVFVIRGTDTTRTGLIVDELSVTHSGGRTLLHRVYRTDDRVLGMRLDTLVDELQTLRPVRHRSRTDRGQESLDFAAGKVTGWMRLANGDSVTVEYRIDRATYNSSSVDLMLRASPLAEGWQSETSMFLPTTRTSVGFRARVRASEVIDGIATWRVAAEFTATPVSFWIAKDTRKLIKQEMRVAPNVTILFARVGLFE